ncbi:MAG: phenylalanine--tRNA ligase subunit beta [Candidatus Omnitrophica bacterium]|nr:phenylalanine--tRNA ligase subunit beta [Candidatus Omnitrophota bacterium]MBU4472896.1 phenylalanine--tRNA ligase subunit beta [Candidatus Omnitrophota bacterium]MCG2706144.1 phenylalanine--tRNA ligase subunit beta [Candidatus Omnitrophota bacterium]
MKFTYNWLKDFVDIKISPQGLAHRLTMAGLEVVSLDEKDGDVVFEIEVTPNRADCLSVMGIAREVAAITDKKFNVKSLMFNAKNIKHSTLNIKQISIKIEDKKDCPFYTAKIIQGVKVGPSPQWLKKRLELIACRSVNNIVDITNYVLFSWGQPLHAFNLDNIISGGIVVRRAKNGERIVVIDAAEKSLDQETLVIADEKRPVAIAGIMGGKDTEITEGTNNILLEAAVFNPSVVRRSRQILGLGSESAYRFERGVDAQMVEYASWRAVELIERFAGGRCIAAKSSPAIKTKDKNINFNLSDAQKILGVNIAPAKAKKILNNLGLQIKTKTKNNLKVKIPSYRPDLNLEVDLVEEIARIFGYDNIPKSLPAVRPQIGICRKPGPVSFIKNILLGLGLNEVITYSLMDKASWEYMATDKDRAAIEILNPLSKEQEILRPGLALSLARCVAYNLNQKQDYINIFEVAKVFSQSLPQPQEELVLGIALCGTKPLLTMQGLRKEEAGVLDLKGIVEVLFSRLGIKDYNFVQEAERVAVYVSKEKAGVMLRLPKETLDYLEIKNKKVWTAELFLHKLLPRLELRKKFTPLPIYPGISRDISLILKEEIELDNVLKGIRETGTPLLQEVKVVDCYKGKQIPGACRGLTISCFYRAPERTLTEAEINPLHARVCRILTERFRAQIR